MALTNAQNTALRTEIQTDPRGYGYAANVAAGADGAIADTLTLIRDGTTGRVPTTPTATGGQASGIITVRRTDIGALELLDAIDVRDFIANANNLQASWFESVTQAARVRLSNDDGTDTRTFTNLRLSVGNTNGSQTRLAAVATRSGSRAEELFGRDSRLTADDVSRALSGIGGRT